MKTVTILASLSLVLLLVSFPVVSRAAQQVFIPDYIVQGLSDYKAKGYEAAVTTWLKGSPFEHATEMATRIAFFQNIEKLYGKYVGHDIVFVEHTETSSRVYVRMNFERTAGYIMFTSLPLNNKWSLNHIDLDRLQKFGSNAR